jgi:hypothetical protein
MEEANCREEMHEVTIACNRAIPDSVQYCNDSRGLWSKTNADLRFLAYTNVNPELNRSKIIWHPGSANYR